MGQVAALSILAASVLIQMTVGVPNADTQWIRIAYSGVETEAIPGCMTATSDYANYKMYKVFYVEADVCLETTDDRFFKLTMLGVHSCSSCPYPNISRAEYTDKSCTTKLTGGQDEIQDPASLFPCDVSRLASTAPTSSGMAAYIGGDAFGDNACANFVQNIADNEDYSYKMGERDAWIFVRSSDDGACFKNGAAQQLSFTPGSCKWSMDGGKFMKSCYDDWDCGGGAATASSSIKFLCDGTCQQVESVGGSQLKYVICNSTSTSTDPSPSPTPSPVSSPSTSAADTTAVSTCAPRAQVVRGVLLLLSFASWALGDADR